MMLGMLTRTCRNGEMKNNTNSILGLMVHTFIRDDSLKENPSG